MSEANAIEAMPGVVRIGNVVIDQARRRVERDGATIELSQRPFDLLCLFLAEPRTLHTRKDLFRRIWKGVVVEDANLSQGVWVLRRALGEQGKDWIRTVAKSGYVFDPPLPIESIGDTPAAGAATLSSETDLLPSTAHASAAAWRGRPFVLAMMAAIALVAVAWGAWRFLRPSEPLRVLVIAAPSNESPPPSVPQWPVQLLREWLEWKLSREPDVLVVSALQLADADERGRIVLLSVSESPGDAQRVRLHAHIGNTDEPGGITIDALPDDITQAADRITGAIVDRLLPAGAVQPFPPLVLDAAGAQDYIVATQRREAGRPAEAVAALEAVLKRRPEFGLARLQLAEMLDELGQIGAAKQQMAFAEQWISRLPPAALRIQKAREAMLARDYPAAADAYAALVRDYPYQPRFRLDRARASRLAQRYADATRALDGIDWNLQPLRLRVEALLARAEVQCESGALDAAKKTAEEARKLADDAGWSLERARALLIFANASINDASAEKWLPFDRAAEQFEQAGDRMNMLRARLAGEMMRPPERGAGADTLLMALLGEARAAGNREIEVDALRLVARRFRRAADFVRSRDYLVEATAVAQASGDEQRDAALRRDLALVSMVLGDFPTASRHLAEFDAAKPQGTLRLLAGQIKVRLENYRGRYDKAAEAADAVTADPIEASTISAAMIDCDRTQTLIATGDLAAAQLAAERCMRSNLPYDLAAGNLAIAKIAVASGDNAEAARRIAAALPALQQLPDVDRWDLGAIAQGLRVRIGDRDGVEAALSEILSQVAPGHVRVTEIEARLGLAELALARGDVAAAQTQIAALREIVPGDDWYAQSRLALIDAASAFHRGDVTQAQASLRTLDEAARAHADIAMELRAHRLAVSWGNNLCPEARDRELVAKSGIRGASESWLLGDRFDASQPREHLVFDRRRTDPPEGR